MLLVLIYIPVQASEHRRRTVTLPPKSRLWTGPTPPNQQTTFVKLSSNRGQNPQHLKKNNNLEITFSVFSPFLKSYLKMQKKIQTAMDSLSN